MPALPDACADVAPLLTASGSTCPASSTPTECEFYDSTGGRTCSAKCRDAGLLCVNGWDDDPADPSHCGHYDSGHAAVENSVAGAQVGRTGTTTLEDFAPGGCENPYGGQICRCSSTGECSVETSYPFSWVDIASGAGTAITEWEQGEDDGWYHIQMPFYINWFGTNEATVTIGTNGIISFGTSHMMNGASEPIPCAWSAGSGGGCIGVHYCSDCTDAGTATDAGYTGVLHGVDGVLAPFWCDLDPSAGDGSVFWHVQDMTDVVARGPAWSKLIVTWQDVRVFTRDGQRFDSVSGQWVGDGGSVPAPNTFQIVLFGDGAVLFQYLEMDPVHHSWSQESIGFEDQTGNYGVQISIGAIPPSGTAYFVPASCHVYHQMSGHSGSVHATAAEYQFNGNADDLAGANHGDIVKAGVHDGDVCATCFVADRFGIPNAAMHFDGATYVEVDAPFPHVNSVFAIALWVKVDTLGGTHAIVGYQADGDTGDTCCCPLRSPSLLVGDAGDLMYDSCAPGGRGSVGSFGGSGIGAAGDGDSAPFFEPGAYVHLVWTKDLTQHSRYAHEYRFCESLSESGLPLLLSAIPFPFALLVPVWSDGTIHRPQRCSRGND